MKKKKEVKKDEVMKKIKKEDTREEVYTEEV